MSMYDSFIARMEANGVTPKIASENVTRRNQISLIMNSPSRSDVRLNDEENTRPSIVSDTETFHKRRFLFLPDSEISVGDYIHHDGEIYLATDRKTNPIYPELFGEHCNDIFPLFKGTISIDTGKVDYRGAPIYEDIDDIANIPCVMTTKVYSALSNSEISLPTGAMVIKIPYDADNIVEVNYSIQPRKSEYKVTDVRYQYVVDEIGYVEIHLQREVKDNE